MTGLEAKKAILERIRKYDRIVISRHSRPDGDAIGSTKGLCESLRLSFPSKDIRVINEDLSEHLSFLGGEDDPVDDAFYGSALAIVLDTATLDRISNKKALLAKEVIKIDHHIEVQPYGDVSWVEDGRSSVCEMVVDFIKTFEGELKCSKNIATLLFAGMVTDSGRFQFAETSGDTLRLAGYLLDFGIDTTTLYAHLYLEDFGFQKFKANVIENMDITPNGVAYTYISQEIQRKFSLSGEQASSSVGFMDKIKGSLIWMAFIENMDGSTRVRLRSRFVTVNSLAEKYHGGGHAFASGATVYSTEEMKALVDDADKLLGDYKSNNGGWL